MMRRYAPPQGTGIAIRQDAATFAYGSALFNAAGLTDSATVWTQPANSILLGAKIRLDVAFVATGMTDLDITLGDAGDNDGLTVKAMNLTSDAVSTEYATKGAYWDATAAVGGTLHKESATAWVAYATAVGANLSTLSAGQVTFIFTYIQL